MERPGALTRRVRAQLRSGANRIALSGAVRTMIAVAVPFVALPLVGLGPFSHVAALSALGITNVDVGGPYRTRLAAMALAAVGAPLLLALGATVESRWILAAAVMAAVALATGMIRAVGPGGISLGINLSFAFLIGIAFGPEAGDRVHHYALAYLGGGAWTIVLTIAFWQLRPYRRFEQEAAIAWEAVAALVAAALQPAEGGLARRRHERDLDARHADARRAIEQARSAIGRLRDDMAGPGTTIGQLVVLLTAAARVEAAAVTLSETEVTDADAGRALEAACRAVARALLAGRGEVDLAALRAATGAPAGGPGALAFAQALRNLEAADDALHALTAHRHGLRSLLAMPFATRSPVNVIAALRPHVTTRSAIFRHALRVAVVTAAATGLTVRLELPHGVWLPMTALLVLQPGFGDTLRRAGQRSAGTLAGAAGAGALLATVHGTVVLDLVIPLLAGATAFFRRRLLAHATAFQTPLIMLLLGYGTASGWTDIVERIAYTALGAAVAIAAAFALWPHREREQLARVLARAVRAAAAYVDAVLAGDRPRLMPPAPTPGPTPRRAAETELANADLAFQRLAGEPSHRRGGIAASFMLTVHLHRLIRQAIAIEAHLDALPRDDADLGSLRRLIAGGLDDVAKALEAGQGAGPRPAFDAPLAGLTARLAAAGAPAALATALGKLVSAATALNAAAAPGTADAAVSRTGR